MGAGQRNRGVAVIIGGSSRRVTIAESGVLARGGNSFGLLRLVFAGSVIASHSYLIGALGKEPLFALSHGRLTLGSVAVWGFFGLSGALVGLSAEGAATTTYLWHRARRILPAYWACLMVSAFGFGALIARLQHLPLATIADPANLSARTFVVNNVTLGYQQAPVGGVLNRLPYTFAVNGSLWSLAYEAACYLMLLAFVQGWIASRKRDLVIGSALALSIVLAFSAATHYTFPLAAPVASLIQVPFLGSLDPALLFPLWSVFLTGACLALWRDRIPLSPTLTTIAAIVCACSVPLGWFVPAGALAMPYALIGIGYYLPRCLRSVGTRNDFSYGLYLYGFPVGQALVAAHREWSAGALMVATFALTLPLAAASWFAVERFFLRPSSARRIRGERVATQTIVLATGTAHPIDEIAKTPLTT
jgi:peptidoglycan/LPS O-acetylase OafA/YrhL